MKPRIENPPGIHPRQADRGTALGELAPENVAKLVIADAQREQRVGVAAMEGSARRAAEGVETARATPERFSHRRRVEPASDPDRHRLGIRRRIVAGRVLDRDDMPGWSRAVRRGAVGTRTSRQAATGGREKQDHGSDPPVIPETRMESPSKRHRPYERATEKARPG